MLPHVQNPSRAHQEFYGEVKKTLPGCGIPYLGNIPQENP